MTCFCLDIPPSSPSYCTAVDVNLESTLTNLPATSADDKLNAAQPPWLRLAGLLWTRTLPKLS